MVAQLREGGKGVLRTDNTADPVHAVVDLLLANGVVTTGIVVGSILLSAQHVLGVEQGAVGASPDLVNRRGVQIEEDGPRDVFAIARLGEEGLIGATLDDVLRVGIGPAVGAEAVLQEIAAVERSAPGVLVRRGWGGRTAPRPSYPAGHQPDPGEDGGSREREAKNTLAS